MLQSPPQNPNFTQYAGFTNPNSRNPSGALKQAGEINNTAGTEATEAKDSLCYIHQEHSVRHELIRQPDLDKCDPEYMIINESLDDKPEQKNELQLEFKFYADGEQEEQEGSDDNNKSNKAPGEMEIDQIL